MEMVSNAENKITYEKGKAMYVRVTIDPVQPGKMDAAIKIERDSILPAAKTEKGFKGLYFLTNRQTGKGMTISMWDTEADMKAAEKSGYYREQIAKLLPLVSGPTIKEHYEVSVQEI
jgi:heme-degrading monooxygenase HmoA